MLVTISRTDDKTLIDGKGSAGFRIGIQGTLEDYRNALVFGNGLDIGFNVVDGLFIGRVKSSKPAKDLLDRKEVMLSVYARPKGDHYQITLIAHDSDSGEILDQIENENITPDRMRGNVALVNNHAGGGRRGDGSTYGLGAFRFSDWFITGTKIEDHPERAFGPILFSQYTLSNSILKLTAQMPPLGEEDSQTVKLEIQGSQVEAWHTLGEERIHPEARTVTFRIADWHRGKHDWPYRLSYVQNYKSGNETRRGFTNGPEPSAMIPSIRT